MADNTTLNTMTGGDVIATDDVTGVKYQKVKLVDGTLDSTTVIVSGGGVEAAALRVTLASDSTGVVSVDDNGGILTVDGTVSANATLTAETTKVIGTVNVAAAQTIAVTNAGTFATQAAATLNAETTKVIGTVNISANQDLNWISTIGSLYGGGIAHGAADSGNPVKVGGRVDLTPSTATIMADNDRSDDIHDSDGAKYVRGECLLGDCLTERVANTNGTSTASTVFGATASTRNVIHNIIGYNTSATAGFCDLLDGSGGTILLTIPLPAGGGAVINLGSVPIKTTANTALYFDVSGALTTVYLTFTGYKSKVA